MRNLFRRFRKSDDGLAAAEFAMIAPVMITMFFGTVELSNALNARQNVTNMASTAADLVAQQSTINNADMTNVQNAVTAVLYPYPTDTATIIITSVIDDGKGGGKVAWSDAKNGTARKVGDPVTDLPTGLITKGSGQTVILAEITYKYSSASSQLLTSSPLTMQSKFYAKPRRSLAITRTAT